MNCSRCDILPTTSAITSYISNQWFATTSQIPTKTSDLTNDSGFITSSDLPTYPPSVAAGRAASYCAPSCGKGQGS